MLIQIKDSVHPNIFTSLPFYGMYQNNSYFVVIDTMLE